MQGERKPTAAPTPHFVQLLTTSLYQKVELVGGDPDNQVRALRAFRGKFDMYCPECGTSTTWSPVVSGEVETRLKAEEGAPVAPFGRTGGGLIRNRWLQNFCLTIQCARKTQHESKFYFVVDPNWTDQLLGDQSPAKSSTSITKIGQWPSITDFQLGEVADFEAGMSKSQRQGFVRATNCAAHGFSVAACVHFRRVFESVLIEARDVHMDKRKIKSWPKFERARTDERIRLLRGELPAFMSEHPQLYGILSLGVHELTEDQCAEELPMLRRAIKLIMEDRVTKARARRERAEVSQLVAQGVDRYKKKR